MLSSCQFVRSIQLIIIRARKSIITIICYTLYLRYSRRISRFVKLMVREGNLGTTGPPVPFRAGWEKLPPNNMPDWNGKLREISAVTIESGHLPLYGPTFNVISPVQQKTRLQCAKVERRLCRIATSVYAVAATKRVTRNSAAVPR